MPVTPLHCNPWVDRRWPPVRTKRRSLPRSSRGQRTICGLDAEQRRAHRREQLLTAAFELIARDGYPNTSIEQICQAAYVGNKAFYEVFDSKEDCYLALLTQIAERIEEQAVAALADAPMIPTKPSIACCRRSPTHLSTIPAWPWWHSVNAPGSRRGSNGPAARIGAGPLLFSKNCGGNASFPAYPRTVRWTTTTWRCRPWAVCSRAWPTGCTNERPRATRRRPSTP